MMPNAPRGKRHQQAQGEAIQIGLVHFAQFDQLLVSFFAAFAGGAAFHEKIADLDNFIRGEPVMGRPGRRDPQNFRQIHDRVARNGECQLRLPFRCAIAIGDEQRGHIKNGRKRESQD